MSHLVSEQAVCGQEGLTAVFRKQSQANRKTGFTDMGQSWQQRTRDASLRYSYQQTPSKSILHESNKFAGLDPTVRQANSELGQTFDAIDSLRATPQSDLYLLTPEAVINQRNSEIRAMRALLKNVVTSEQSLHQEFTDGFSGPFECFPKIALYLKIRVADRCLPLKVKVIYENEKTRDLTLWMSCENPKPDDKKNNGVFIRPVCFTFPANLNQLKSSESTQWLYFVAMTSYGCRFKLQARFKGHQSNNQSKQKKGPERQVTVERSELDFRQFSLGQGSVAEKQERLALIKQSILNDEKQAKLVKEVTQQIKSVRSRKTHAVYGSLNQSVDTDSCGQDFLSMNINAVSQYREHERNWGEFFKLKSDRYRENARHKAAELQQEKRTHNQVLLAKWVYIKEKKADTLKKFQKKVQHRYMLKFWTAAAQLKRLVNKVNADFQKLQVVKKRKQRMREAARVIIRLLRVKLRQKQYVHRCQPLERSRQMILMSTALSSNQDVMAPAKEILANFCKIMVGKIDCMQHFFQALEDIEKIKGNFKRHMRLQRYRKSILLSMWAKEEQNLHFKKYPPGSEKHQTHQKLLDAFATDIYDRAKMAVVEKYLTFSKNLYLDRVMQWRLRLMAYKFSPSETKTLKVILGMHQATREFELRLVDPETGALVRDYNSLGKKIDKIPALLNPDLTFAEAKQQHHDYINSSYEVPLVPSDLPQYERKLAMKDLCQDYPVVQPFIPTASVLHKLITKATQLTSDDQILMQINPKERKRLTNENDLEEPIYEPYCEVRIRPSTLVYPTCENNWPGFFEETGLPHLAEKFKPYDMRSDMQRL